MMEDVNTECKKFCADWASFHKVTQVLVKAVRRIHHGVREEHTRLSEGDRPSGLRSTVLARHVSAYKKVILGLQDYSANFLEMEEQYQELVKNRTKFCNIQFSRVVERHSQIEMQRDTILFSVESMIKAQLRVAASDFTERSKKLLDAGIFDVIGAYNEVLVKLKHIVPKKDPQLEEEEDEEDEEAEEKEKMYRTVMPETLIPPLSCLKQITASKVLQTVARERAPRVTQTIAETLLQEFRIPTENGTPLPWKPITFHSKPGVVTGDIFEDAIAKEEDENKINQQKLDLALRMEFGEDFPGTDYLPANDSGDIARPISCSAVDALIATNTELLNLLVDKFTKTTGVLVKGMVKQSKTGEKRLSKAARTRIETYYVERVWGEGSEFVEELMLWVPPSTRPPPYPPPALLPPQTLFHILTTYQHFCNRGLVPESCRASCEGLVDECRHLATSSILDWGCVRGVGAYARASPPPHKLPDGNYSTAGGNGGCS